MLRDILKLIITGQEHSGTSITLRTFTSTKGLQSGFECGVLCSPGGIKGFPSYHPYGPVCQKNWKVPPQEFENLVRLSSTYEDFYKGLRKSAGCITDKSTGLIDKTPMYIYKLSKIVKITEDVPIIIMRKDPKNHFCSMKARKWSVERFISWYKKSWRKDIVDIIDSTHRIKLVQFEDFITNPKPIIEDVCEMMQIKYCEKDYESILSTFRSDEVEKYNSSFPYRGPHSKRNKGKQTLTRSEIEKINKELVDFVVM
jgi:hypothetical protein